MALPLRLLLVEDSADDADLMLRELRQAGYDPTCQRVQTAAELKAALAQGPWDLVISDYVLPRFSAPGALALVQESELDIPFIIVSGAIGEETAVQAMRAGARDYIMKGNLTRLAPAIVRELREAGARRERKQFEEQFRQAQRLEAIGRLAGGVAHDFNNLLTVISSRSQFILDRLPSIEPSHREAGLILEAAHRAAALTRQLLVFSRGQVLPTRTLNLNFVVAEMDGMLRRLIGEHIDLQAPFLDPTLGSVKADQGHVEQVIMNLLVNARDAMPDGGRLTIETANVDLDDAYCRARVGTSPGPHVMLAVTDDGVGMDAETQAHLFEPFFTTKGTMGTGLGLAVVYGIVKQSGGSISVLSAPGQGTSIKILLPRVDATGEETQPSVVFAGTVTGTETILLVEDEEDVRTVLGEILRGHGYTVLEAHDGDQALQLLAAHEGVIHLIVTDLVMPHVGGRELVGRMMPGHPGVRVLFVSGYTDDAITDYDALGADFLEKPFTPTGLVRKVREILNTPRKGAPAIG